MPNRYELLSTDVDSPKSSSPKSPLESDEGSWSGWSSSGRTSSSRSSSGQERVRKKHLRSVENPERRLLYILNKRNWLTDDGKPIDYDVLKKYLKQVEESEGFNITDFPGVILGVTSFIPFKSLIDDREELPKQYDEMKDLATLATKTYNNKHQAEFKVVDIEDVNILYTTFSTYYITFSAVDVSARNYGNRSLQSSLYNQFVKTRRAAQLIWITLLIWLAAIFLPDGDDEEDMELKTPKEELQEKLLKLQSAPELRAGMDDLLDYTFPRKIFQAVVADSRKREVLSCRVAK